MNGSSFGLYLTENLMKQRVGFAIIQLSMLKKMGIGALLFYAQRKNRKATADSYPLHLLCSFKTNFQHKTLLYS